MAATRRYDLEFRQRAVRVYRDRLEQDGGSLLAARRHVGELLDLNTATLRNWVEDGERQVGDRPARVSEDEEVRALRRRDAELERANESLKTSAAVFAHAKLDRRLRDRGLHRLASGVDGRRADLCGPDRGRGADRAAHLLRPQGHPGHPGDAAAGVPGQRADRRLAGQLGRLRSPQALARRPPRRPGHRSGPGRPAHDHRRHQRGGPRPAPDPHHRA